MSTTREDAFGDESAQGGAAIPVIAIRGWCTAAAFPVPAVSYTGVSISGGFGSLDPELQITSSRRVVLSDEDVWLVAARSSGTDTFTVQAVCTDFPPMHQ